MAGLKRHIIIDQTGDGVTLRWLPGPLSNLIRPLILKSRKQRQERLVRVANRLYPMLQALEEATMPADKQMLSSVTIEDACRDPNCIERGLVLFRVAREGGLLEIRQGGLKSAPLKRSDYKTPVNVCGMSVSEGERFYLYRAGRLIMKRHPEVDLDNQNALGELRSLGHLRLLAALSPAVVVELQQVMKDNFALLFKEKFGPAIKVMRIYKPFHIRALRKALGSRFETVFEWDPERLQAIGESFECEEQIEDLGTYIELLEDPLAIRAFGTWEKHDVTARINAEREERNKPPLKHSVYETDVGFARKLLVNEFSLVVEKQASVIEAIGKRFAIERALEDPQERNAHLTAMKGMAKRYLKFLSPEAVDALQVGGNPKGGQTITMQEIFGILEGIWAKEGIGRRFFEEGMEGPAAPKALANIVASYLDMRNRGSLKEDTDIASVITGSDIFDVHLQPFFSTRAL